MRPTSAAELADALRAARDQNQAVAPRGGGTKSEIGPSPEREDFVLETGGLAGFVEWAPENLTATVQAGSSIEFVQRELATRGQFLPIDPPLPERATIGGVLATAVNGSLRLGHGPARDALIGSVVATSDGKLLKTGGRVVKNVAGYDLNKLFVGSLGTVGVLVQATFKIAPLPEAQSAVLARFADADGACAGVDALRTSFLSPMALEVVAPETCHALARAWSSDEWIVAARFGGVAAAVKRAVGEAERLLESAGSTHVSRHELGADTAEADPLWRPLRNHGAEADLRVRIGVRPTDLRAALSLVRGALPSTQVRAHAATAVIYASGDVSSPLEAVIGVTALRHAIDGFAANVVVERAPAEARAALGSIGVWGAPGDDLEIMQRLKQAFDPSRTINPGRYVGGI